MEKVLITGGNGLIGLRLTSLLLKQGYEVNLLGRTLHNQSEIKGVKSFLWDVENGELDNTCLQGVSSIIHLAGAGIAESRWTEKRKQEITDSRVKSTKLLHDSLKKEPHTVNAFISAAAVGFYGDCGDELVTENHKPGKDFLAEVCKKWEKGALKIGTLGIREARLRFGIVLAKNGGALPELTKTMAAGVAGYFSKDNLYYPWIHIDDVCGIIIEVLKNEKLSGAYNTTAPTPLLMKDLMKAIVKAKHSNALVLPVPPLAIKLTMGQMSEMLLCSQKCSAEKIIAAGYKFRYGKIEIALSEIFKNS